jgi:hypothetical protein
MFENIILSFLQISSNMPIFLKAYSEVFDWSVLREAEKTNLELWHTLFDSLGSLQVHVFHWWGLTGKKGI